MPEPEVLTKIIVDVSNEIMAEEKFKRLEQINQGMCAVLARRVADIFPRAVILQGTGHWFLRYSRKFYDAEAPEGVRHFHELPFYRREPGLAKEKPQMRKN